MIQHGTILLTLLMFAAWAQTTTPTVGGESPVEGDMLFRPNSSFSSQLPARLWTSATVPYFIDPNIPNQTRINDAIAYFNQNTPLKFQPRAGETNFVHYVRSTVGNGICSSNVGMIGGEQFINVEDTCNTGTLIHEMGHTVGFLHEQSRQDRNQYVTVLYENIDKSGFSNFPVNTAAVEQDVGPYDFASHMHYSTYEYSRTALPVLQSVPAGIPLNPYSVLSPGDLDTLFRLYGKPPTQTTVVTNPPGLRLTIDGETVTSPQVFNWPAGSTHALSVADQPGSSGRYVFGRWSDGGAQTHSITSTPAVTVYSANMIQQVLVTTGVSTPSGGSVALDSSSPDDYFAIGTVLQMTATPAPGYTFLSWSGGTTCPRANSANPATFVTGATNVVCNARFTQSPVTTIATDPPGLPVAIDGITYNQSPVNALAPGSTHTISTAAPASNPTSPTRYLFLEWSDGGAASHSVTAGASSATITARYKTQYSVVRPSFAANVATFTLSPSSPDGFYDAGTQVQVTAIPGPGWQFYQWTRDLAGQPNPGTLTMSSQMAFGAVFYQTPPALATASGASFANGAVSPGELITIFGAGIGPPVLTGGVIDASGKLSGSVANTQVTFDGVPAPIVYVAQNQASVLVPYEIAGKSSTTAAVTLNGRRIASAALLVDPAAPGIFTANSSGSGNVAAINQDGSFNSPSNPAAKGSVVVLFATGEGQLSPGGVNGAFTGAPPPLPVLPVALRIGGKSAQLLYAGEAPQEVSGVLQINALVPPDAPSGSQVSVYLVIGNYSSPLGATIAIK